MTLQLTGPVEGYSPPPFVDPPPYGYIYIGASVEPPRRRAPFPGRSRKKNELLAHLITLTSRLTAQADVVRATLYRATLMPPLSAPGPRAPFDIAVLVETTSLESMEDVCQTRGYSDLRDTLETASAALRVMQAACIRCIKDVAKKRCGTYLFNHFATEGSKEDALALWEHLAGWYTAETGLDNSTLLAPVKEDGDFVFVNHARWDERLPRVMVDQLFKRSFRSYVLANLKANRVTARPVLYKVVHTAGAPQGSRSS
jgi:hypothetical protein